MIEKDKIIGPSKEEVEKNIKLEMVWCKHEKKFVYNPTRKKHCPYCRRLL